MGMGESGKRGWWVKRKREKERRGNKRGRNRCRGV